MSKKIYILLLSVIFILVIFLLVQKNILDKKYSALEKEKLQLSNKLIALNKELGRYIAKTNCWSCHKFNAATDNRLAEIVQRLGEPYLRLYITSQDSLLKASDKYAVELKNAYGNLGNSHNFKLTETELSALIEFMK